MPESLPKSLFRADIVRSVGHCSFLSGHLMADFWSLQQLILPSTLCALPSTISSFTLAEGLAKTWTHLAQLCGCGKLRQDRRQAECAELLAGGVLEESHLHGGR